MDKKLKKRPHEPVSRYRHNGCEDNGDTHLKRQIMGRGARISDRA